MKATSSELLMGNFNEIFIELDPLKRAALLAESYAEDCLWIHPGGRVVGREGINEAATEIRKHFPEYRYTVTGEIQIMHNVATCRWEAGCQVNRSTTRERTSSKSVMVACRSCTPSLTRSYSVLNEALWRRSLPWWNLVRFLKLSKGEAK